jgi:uncharacterized protein YhbP (UPF0306 family)
MNSKIEQFITKERVCCLAVIIENNVLHGAAVHYSHQSAPLKLFFQTTNKTVKAAPFLNGEIGNASVVIGQSEQDWLTLQMRGTVRKISSPEELREVYKIHYKKHPEAEQYKNEATVFLEFTPVWWRYTDFNTEPETIIES